MRTITKNMFGAAFVCVITMLLTVVVYFSNGNISAALMAINGVLLGVFLSKLGTYWSDYYLRQKISMPGSLNKEIYVKYFTQIEDDEPSDLGELVDRPKSLGVHKAIVIGRTPQVDAPRISRSG